MASVSRSKRIAVGLLLVLLAAGCALLLGYASVNVNRERACATADTPYLEICPKVAPGSAEHLSTLLSRVSANPGDAPAYVQLAFYDLSKQRESRLRAAQAVAPNELHVLQLQAASAVERQDWPKSVALLVQLVEYHNQGQAALTLARMIGAGYGPLMKPLITPGSRWFPVVLTQLAAANTPFSVALPLVSEGFAQGVVGIESMRSYIRQLKGAGAWADAFALWIALHGKPQPVLYNSSFDQPFQPDGFDWEHAAAAPSRAGAIVRRTRVAGRGSVLDIQFTGRAMTVPLIRQLLFLGEGRYAVRGEYMARQLRAEQGFVWTTRCIEGGLQAGRSALLADTGGSWRPFAIEFRIPSGCGMVASLQLETVAPTDATLGARGSLFFDTLALEKMTP